MDTPNKNNIDIDRLVDSILQGRTADKNHDTSANVSASNEVHNADDRPTPLTPADVFSQAWQNGVDARKSENAVEFDREASSDDTVDEPVKPDRIKKKEKRRGRRKKKYDDDEDQDDWDDWGLKPIGHYRAEESVSSDAPAVAEVPMVEPIAPTKTMIEPEPVDEQPPKHDQPAEDAVIPAAVSDVVISETKAEPFDVPEAIDQPAMSEKEPTPIAETPIVEVTVGEFPPVQAVTETITIPVVRSGADDMATRVIPIGDVHTSAAEPGPDIDPIPENEQLPDQLSLEELVRVEEIAEETAAAVEDEESEEEIDIEEQLRRNRQEKVRDFVLGGEEEEVNEPEEEVTEPEEEPITDEFTAYDDKEAIDAELQYRSRTSLLGMLLTGLLELVLVLVTVITQMLGASPIGIIGYLAVHFFALGLMIVLNAKSVGSGLTGLFALRANGHTAAALASVVTLCGVLLHFFNLHAALPIWTPLAGALLLWEAMAQYLLASRVRSNFSFVAYRGDKYTAELLQDEETIDEITRRASMEGDASVAIFRPVDFLTDFVENSFDEDAGDDWTKWFTPIMFFASLAISLAMLLTGKLANYWEWLHQFLGLVCLSATTVPLALQLAVSGCCRKMLRQGGFMVGWKAVRAFGRPDAVVVDVADLYPDESMLLHGIKTFAGAHIDDAIIDAASLSVRAGGPISRIFLRIIQNQENLLHEVDSLVYEQGMGLAGWVAGRRVLVGNRRLLENHGVDVPSSDYEARYAKNGRRLVYLSTAGELSAMFVVSYLPDATVTDALQSLCRSKLTLLVRSNDPNITSESLCQDFELDEYYVDVLPMTAGRQYDRLLEQGESESTALLASNGHILGTSKVMTACRNMRMRALIALLLEVLVSVFGLIFGTVWTSGNDVLIPALLFAAIGTAITCLAAGLKRI